MHLYHSLVDYYSMAHHRIMARGLQATVSQIQIMLEYMGTAVVVVEESGAAG